MAECFIVRLNGTGGASSNSSRSPKFSYTGNYELINDGVTENGICHWRIKFFTSGTLRFSDLGDFKNGIDVFCVGGGGGSSQWWNGGGGGGYTSTTKNVNVSVNTDYLITVGAGSTETGGTSSAFNCSADGGSPNGGPGGSGGGAYGGYSAGNGGSNGSDGGYGVSYEDYPEIQGYGGAGQGTTTCEFGEDGNTLYSGGGGGSTSNHGVGRGAAGGAGGGGTGEAQSGNSATEGETNTGGGGGGSYTGAYTSGGSGIVVIRTTR